MIRNFWPIWIMFFCNIIKVNDFLYRFITLLHLISSFSFTRSLLVPYAYLSIVSIDCISVKTLCLSLLKICCVVSYEFFMLSFAGKETIYVNFIFLGVLFYSQVELLLYSYYNFQILVFL